MTNKKTTRRALFSSVISLILCLSMLVGTTMAWFTDEVKSGNNTILAGNLDVELTHSNNTVTDEDVDSATNLFKDVTLWEPGAVAYENFTVKNAGSLALKYQLSINFSNENKVNGHGLSEVLRVAVVKDGFDGNRDVAKELPYNDSLSSFVLSDELEKGDSKTYGIVIYWEPTVNDNLFNMNNLNKGNQLQINLGVTLLATQLDSENDSFGSTYDIEAVYPGQSTPSAPSGSSGSYSDVTVTTEGNTPATVTIPATVIQSLADDAVTKVQLVADDYKLTSSDDSVTVTYGDVGLYDQNGQEIDLSGNTTPIAVKLYVGNDYAGMVATISHEDEVIATATVDDSGFVTYYTLHFCKVSISVADEPAGDIIVDGEIEDELPEELDKTKLVQMLVGNHYYTVSAGMADSWYEYPSVPGKIEADIYLPQDLLAYSLIYKNGDLTETGSHSELKLQNDLDFTGINWTPIGRFYTNIHGNGYTISNLSDSLLGCVYDCQINDLTLENVTASGSASGVVGKELAGDIILSNLTIAGTNTVTYKADSATNWPDGGTGVGAICGVSLIGCSAPAQIDVTVTGTITVNYNDIFFGNTTNWDNLGVSKEFGLNLLSENTYTGNGVSNSKKITTYGTCHLLDYIAEGLYKDRLAVKTTYYVEGKAGLLNVNTLIANATTGEGRGITVNLMTDVNLSGETWKPIDKMWIEFDGNGHTVSNMKTEAWKAGFFGYLGGGFIKNLTLENVDVTGAQAGAFAGSAEGNIDNCYLKGTNTITWAPKYQYEDPNGKLEPSSGIGAITGVTASGTFNATITEGSVVNLDKGIMDTNIAYVNVLTGYLSANKGTVTNNGSIKVDIASADGLTKEIAAAIDGIIIEFTDDITGDVTALQKPDVDVTIDGNDYNYTGTIYLHGQARTTGAETITIKNVNFVTDVADDFIDANSTGSVERYAHNLTVMDCSFSATGEGDVVALRLRQTYNITVKNCTATGLHSVIWATGGNGITVDNVTASCYEGGVSFGTTNNVVVKNSKFEASYAYGYGIRVNAEGKYNLTVSNCEITAKAPVLIRAANGSYSATLENNILNATGDYQIIVTASDYKEGVTLTAPTGNYTLNGADDLTVYPN